MTSSKRSTITIGGDDELPDAVYLDDELERGVATGGTLFIDDDGSEDAVAPKEASTRGIEPRLRQRRIGVRRAESRRRLRWVAIGAAVLVVVLAVLAVLGSSLFAVDEVEVSGNVYTNPDRLQAVVDDLMGTPVLLVDTTAGRGGPRGDPVGRRRPRAHVVPELGVDRAAGANPARGDVRHRRAEPRPRS